MTRDPSMNQLTFPAKELDAPILVPVDLGGIVGRRNRIRGGPHLAIGHGQRKLWTVGTGRNQSVRLGILVSGLEPVEVPVADAPPLDLAGVDCLVDPYDKVGDGDAQIVAMEHVQIDKVGAEGGQTLVDLGMERQLRQEGTVGITEGIVADAALGDDVEVGPGDVGPGVEPPAEDALGFAGAVRVGQVEAAESLGEGRVEEGEGLVGFGQGGRPEHDAVDGVGVLALLDGESICGFEQEGCGEECYQGGSGCKYPAARGSAATSESAVGAIDADRVGKLLGEHNILLCATKIR